MRLLELLTEASTLAASELTKSPERIATFLRKVKDESPFETVDGDQVVIDKSEYNRLATALKSNNAAAIKKVKTDKGEFALGKFKKTSEFKSDGTLDGKPDTDKISNRGDVAEGILAAALFAKLTARSRGTIGQITSADVWRVVDSLKRSGDSSYSVSVKDAGKVVVNDYVKFVLQIPEPAYLDFIDPTKRQTLSSETNSAVMYANSDDNQNFSEYFYLNGKPDGIEIICDGGNTEKQKISKVDIEVIVKDLTTGKSHKQRMDISLKANAKQFGQVGVGSDRLQDYFSKQESLWGEFGVYLEPIKDVFDEILQSEGLVNALEVSYKYAASELARTLSGDDDDEEYKFIREIVKGIDYYATLRTPNVILVNFKGGGYEMISFKDMEPKLAAVNLTARYNDNTKWPQVEVYDSNSGSILFQVRLKITSDERRNYVEKGPLMSQLFGTSVKKKK